MAHGLSFAALRNRAGTELKRREVERTTTGAKAEVKVAKREKRRQSLTNISRLLRMAAVRQGLRKRQDMPYTIVMFGALGLASRLICFCPSFFASQVFTDLPAKASSALGLEYSLQAVNTQAKAWTPTLCANRRLCKYVLCVIGDLLFKPAFQHKGRQRRRRRKVQAQGTIRLPCR